MPGIDGGCAVDSRLRSRSAPASFASDDSKGIAAPIEPVRWRKAMRADYVIVGAGSAGCGLAHRLDEGPHAQEDFLQAGGGAPGPLIYIPPWVFTQPRPTTLS